MTKLIVFCIPRGPSLSFLSKGKGLLFLDELRVKVQKKLISCYQQPPSNLRTVSNSYNFWTFKKTPIGLEKNAYISSSNILYSLAWWECCSLVFLLDKPKFMFLFTGARCDFTKHSSGSSKQMFLCPRVTFGHKNRQLLPLLVAKGSSTDWALLCVCVFSSWNRTSICILLLSNPLPPYRLLLKIIGSWDWFTYRI